MALLFVAALLGLIPAFIAQSKGRSFGAWWLYGFLLFIVAIIHVLVIPSDSSPSINSSDSRSCPFCAEPIKRQAIKCKHCGSEVVSVPVLQNEGDGTQISWRRLAALALAILITGLIIKTLGLN